MSKDPHIKLAMSGAIGVAGALRSMAEHFQEFDRMRIQIRQLLPALFPTASPLKLDQMTQNFAVPDPASPFPSLDQLTATLAQLRKGRIDFEGASDPIRLSPGQFHEMLFGRDGRVVKHGPGPEAATSLSAELDKLERR